MNYKAEEELYMSFSPVYIYSCNIKNSVPLSRKPLTIMQNKNKNRFKYYMTTV